MVWDEETIRLLRELWAEGLSTAEIGRRLGVSKNAIVGKAHRLDLEARPSPIRRDPPKLLSVSDKPAVEAAGRAKTLPPLPSTVAPPPAAATLRTLRVVPAQPRPVVAPPAATRPVQPNPAPAQAAPIPGPIQVRRPSMACCWPIGEPGTKTFRFCDDASMPGKPYCEEHAKLAYVRIKDRKEDAA
jgi:GcrA cell cycle regulator